MKNKITKEHVNAICQIASAVFDEKTSKKTGVEHLFITYGINKGSSNDYITNYTHLLNGDNTIVRTMNEDGMRVFMENIFSTRSQSQKQNSVQSLRKHIKYYESKTGSTLSLATAIANEFEDRINKAIPVSAQDVQMKFDLDVKDSALLPQENRLLRLSQASKVPEKIIVLSTIFMRNPDVVAETLFRAAGKCERCKVNAPFVRVRDASPYLEVHHIKPLSEGGDDVIENTFALCPNCHRFLHHGITC